MRREKLDLGAVAKSIAADLQEAEPGRRVEFVIESDFDCHGDSRCCERADGKPASQFLEVHLRPPLCPIEFGKSQQT